jgi:site-specific DNA recombinase
VVEDIERASRDTFNSLKLERELADQGIPLFATDEPADITGISPTTILVHRVKQGVAEWFRLQLKAKTWKGLREHTAAGWNLGKVPYGYLAERHPHPNPSKAAMGLTKTRLILDPARAPIVGEIFTWRTDDKLGIYAIVNRLNADPGRYPPADPQAGWTVRGVAAMLRNPKYTGYRATTPPAPQPPPPPLPPASSPAARTCHWGVWLVSLSAENGPRPWPAETRTRARAPDGSSSVRLGRPRPGQARARATARVSGMAAAAPTAMTRASQ